MVGTATAAVIVGQAWLLAYAISGVFAIWPAGVGTFDYDIDGDDYVWEAASFLDEAHRLVIVGNPNSGPGAIRLVNDSLFLDGVED